jgi:hypothetical protein
MSLFTELAITINLLNPLSGFSEPGYRFNPLFVIKAVNYLHSLGYDKSLHVLQLYCDLIEKIDERLPNIPVDYIDFAREPDKIFIVARLLFVCKDKQILLPKLCLGQPNIEPKDPSFFPWFPLHLYQDIPFYLLMKGYTFFGVRQSPDMYLDWCVRECQIREDPLLPSNNPLDSVDKFLESETWRNLIYIGAVKEALSFLEAAFCTMLRLQALKALSNVYPLSKQDEEEFVNYSSGKETDEIWQRHRQVVSRLNIFWNPVTNEYEQKK